MTATRSGELAVRWRRFQKLGVARWRGWPTRWSDLSLGYYFLFAIIYLPSPETCWESTPGDDVDIHGLCGIVAGSSERGHPYVHMLAQGTQGPNGWYSLQPYSYILISKIVVVHFASSRRTFAAILESNRPSNI